MDLNGIGAVVTGAASGLGAATAKLLAESGAKVTIFDLNEEAGRAHAEAIGATFARVNVSDEASVEAGLDAAEQANGVTRVLVNCAGVAPAARWRSTSSAAFWSCRASPRGSRRRSRSARSRA